MKSYNKTLGGFVVAGMVASTALASGPVFAQTLDDALAAAYTNNPDLLSQRETLRGTIEAVPQALGNWRPNVSLNLNAARNYNEANNRTSGKRNQFRSPHEGTITFTQPLYRGGRTVAGVDKSEADVKKGLADLDVKEQSTLLSAVTAYMNVVRDAATVDLNISNEQVLTRQLGATRDRFNVGEITRTDVSQAEAALAGATASRITAEGALEASKATYRQVIGEEPGKLSYPKSLGELPKDLETVLAAARTRHPSILSALYAEESARKNVDLVQGELLPTLNFVGTLDKTLDGSARSSGNEAVSITGQAKLDLTIPLYEQGAVYARTRAAKIAAGKSRIDLDTARALRVATANQAWDALRTARASIVSFSAQIDANTIALEGVRREAQVGSRTVLDVLTAEQTLLTSQVNLARAQRDEVVAAYQLKESIGELTAAQQNLAVNLYRPVDFYNQERNKFIGLSVPDLPEPSGDLK
jgi:outer membrane protein